MQQGCLGGVIQTKVVGIIPGEQQDERNTHDPVLGPGVGLALGRGG